MTSKHRRRPAPTINNKISQRNCGCGTATMAASVIDALLLVAVLLMSDGDRVVITSVNDDCEFVVDVDVAAVVVVVVVVTGVGLGVGLGVGFGVGSGVGFGVGFGVGRGVGAGDGANVALPVGNGIDNISSSIPTPLTL